MIPRAARRFNKWLFINRKLHHNGQDFIAVTRMDYMNNSGIDWTQDELNHRTNGRANTTTNKGNTSDVKGTDKTPKKRNTSKSKTDGGSKRRSKPRDDIKKNPNN